MFIWVSCTGGLKAAQIDEVVDAVNDIAQAGAKAFFSKDCSTSVSNCVTRAVWTTSPGPRI